MKILWLCNLLIPELSKEIGLSETVYGGWISGLYNSLIKDYSNEIVYLFPNFSNEAIESTNHYYSFISCNTSNYVEVERRFEQIILNEKPDVIHVWGTEFPHSLAMANVCKKMGYLDRMIISIQGLISMYGNQTEHFFAGLSDYVVRQKTIRDIIKNDSLIKQRLNFEKRGKCEIETLKIAKKVIGRTEWDYACVKRINPNLEYYFCNESLRETFYSDSWNYEKCEKYSLFVSQCSYPLKGFHRILSIMPEVIKKYPSTRLYTTGDDFTACKRFIDRQRKSYYFEYMRKLITNNGLNNHIIFLGRLNAEEMKRQLLKTHIFISPSSIENSSNSVAEAMLLGVPCISTDVGGIRSMIDDKKEALLYPFNETYLVPYYISKIFDDSEYAKTISQNAAIRASADHNRQINTERMQNIYFSMIHN